MTPSINIRQTLRQRLPRHFRFIPRPLISALERFICQDQMNLMLRETQGLTGTAFCDAILRHLNITFSVNNPQNIPSSAPLNRVLFVSNHPLGGLDGITLIAMLSHATGSNVKFVVNDLLMAVQPLHNVFIPINKHGAQSRNAAQTLNHAFQSPLPVIIFPAGLCSRKMPDGSIADLQWQKTFVNRCIQSQRDIIPLHFNARNSNFFYNFAKLRKALRIPFNLEMTRLPAEIVKSRGAHFEITVGQRIPYTSLNGGPLAAQQALSIRNTVYNLHKHQK